MSASYNNTISKCIMSIVALAFPTNTYLVVVNGCLIEDFDYWLRSLVFLKNVFEEVKKKCLLSQRWRTISSSSVARRVEKLNAEEPL